jgi:hypothetical protein
LLVAAVINAADNVLIKGLATGVSVVLSTALVWFFGTPLTGRFAVGGALLIGGCLSLFNPLLDLWLTGMVGGAVAVAKRQ